MRMLTNTTKMKKKRIHINVIQLADLWFAVSTTTRESCRKKWVASIM